MIPESRRSLIEKLEKLTESDLRSFIIMYYGTEYQPASSSGVTEIVTNFVQWAESLKGPGLEKLQKDLNAYLGIEPDERNPKPNNLPFPSLGKLFVGRDSFLVKLRSEFELLRTQHDGHFQWQVVTALGGIGKSRSAVEYAWRFAGEYTALLFVRAGHFSHILGDLAGLAGPKVLNLGLDPAMLPAKKAEAVLNHLLTNPGWLLIIDNVDDITAANNVSTLLKDLSGGHVLITSRWGEWNRQQFKLHKLDLLDQPSATRLILESTTERSPQEEDAKEAGLLATDLGRLSLALHQAVAFINASPSMTIAGYRRLWNENAQKLAGYNHTGAFLYNTDERGELLTVMTTWQTTFERLSPSARWWADHLAFLAPAPVPDSLAEALQALDPTPEKTGWNEPKSAVAELLNYSLLDKSQTDIPNIGQMHRLVQMVIRETLPPDKQTTTRLTTAAALKQAFSGDPQDHTNWPRLNPLADHVAALLEPFDDKKIAETPADHLDPAGVFGFLGNQCGLMFNGQARYPAAEPMFRRALDIKEKSLGTEHPNVATGLNNLAELLRATNRLNEAEPMYRRATKLFIKSLGPEHPNAITVAKNYLILLLEREYEPERVIAELKSLCTETGTPLEKLLGLLGSIIASHPDANRQSKPSEPSGA